MIRNGCGARHDSRHKPEPGQCITTAPSHRAATCWPALLASPWPPSVAWAQDPPRPRPPSERESNRNYAGIRAAPSAGMPNSRAIAAGPSTQSPPGARGRPGLTSPASPAASYRPKVRSPDLAGPTCIACVSQCLDQSQSVEPRGQRHLRRELQDIFSKLRESGATNVICRAGGWECEIVAALVLWDCRPVRLQGNVRAHCHLLAGRKSDDNDRVVQHQEGSAAEIYHGLLPG